MPTTIEYWEIRAMLCGLVRAAALAPKVCSLLGKLQQPPTGAQMTSASRDQCDAAADNRLISLTPP
jgi:hypothetical protein